MGERGLLLRLTSPGPGAYDVRVTDDEMDVILRQTAEDNRLSRSERRALLRRGPSRVAVVWQRETSS